MLKTFKNIWNLAKHFDVVEEKNRIVLAPKLPLNLGTPDRPIGEVFMDKDTLHMVKEKGANFEQLVIKYDTGDARYVIQSEQGGTGSNRSLALSADGGATRSIFVGTNGNVGINNTSPSSELDVSGQVTVNPESPATAPFIIGANGDGQLVTGLNAEFLNGKSASEFGGSSEVFDKNTAHQTFATTSGNNADVYTFTNSLLPAEEQVVIDDLVEFGAGFTWPGNLGANSILEVLVNNGSSDVVVYDTDGVGGNIYTGGTEFFLRCLIPVTSATTNIITSMTSNDTSPQALADGNSVSFSNATSFKIILRIKNVSAGSIDFDRYFAYVRKQA